MVLEVVLVLLEVVLQLLLLQLFLCWQCGWLVPGAFACHRYQTKSLRPPEAIILGHFWAPNLIKLMVLSVV